MTDLEIKKLISNWKKYEQSYLEEIDGYFLKVFLSRQTIEKIDKLLLEGDYMFSDFIAHAEFAYLLQNNLQDHGTIDISDIGNAKTFAEQLSKESPYKDKEGYFKVFVPISDDEFCALYTFLLLEKGRNNDYSMDDLFTDFVECFENTDMNKIMELELSAYDEIGEEFEKRKH